MSVAYQLGYIAETHGGSELAVQKVVNLNCNPYNGNNWEAIATYLANAHKAKQVFLLVATPVANLPGNPVNHIELLSRGTGLRCDSPLTTPQPAKQSWFKSLLTFVTQ
jgi:hypothetical protein